MKAWRTIAKIGVILVALAAGVFPLLGRLGSATRLGDLLNHFQLQYFTFGLLCAVALAALRSWRLSLLALAVVVYPAWQLAPFYTGWKDAPVSTKGRIRAVTFNVLSSNTRYSEAIAWVRSVNPDVAFFPEVDPGWAAALTQLGNEYPYHLQRPDAEGNFGVALYSRHPLSGDEIRLCGNLQIPLVKAVIGTPSGEVIFYGAHPLPPMGGKYTGERDRCLQEIANDSGRESRPVIVAGDLNATPWSVSMRPIYAAGLVDSSLGRRQGGTWRRGSLVSIPIDHILYRGGKDGGKSLHCGDRWIGPDLGSDHRPVVADLFLD